MKPGITGWMVGSIIVLNSLANAASDAEVLFNTKCAVCHSKTRPVDMTKAAAPAVMGIMRHVKMTYPDKETAIKFMVDYILAPSKEKAVCMPGKIQRFGLMPSQKGNVSKEEAIMITGWMYDTFPRAGFKGMGRGKGMMKGQER